MFNDPRACKLVGTEYASKNQRLALSLQPLDGTPEFKTGFTALAAYRLESNQIGSVIDSIEEVSPAALIAADWDRIVAADQSGTWPGLEPKVPSVAAAEASRVGLRGFRINFASGRSAWVLSRDYVLLGRRPSV